ncbi:MAG: hypothetical protein AAFS10_13915, partial [Myxococcota bacterium]
DAVRNLQTSLGNARLYHLQHPKALEPLKVFVEAMNRATESFGPVVLKASFEGIFWNRDQLFHETEENKGLGNLLYSEGVAELIFTNGLVFWEARKLMEVLRTNFYEELVETLESLLWQSELPHVQVEPVAALAEAEALSSLYGGGSAEVAEAEALERQLDVYINRAKRLGHIRNLKSAIEEIQRRMMAGQDDTNEEENDEEDQLEAILDDAMERLEDDDDSPPEERFLEEYFGAVKDEDKMALELMRAEVSSDNRAQMLLRVIRILIMCQVTRRGELPTEDLNQIVADCMNALYTGGDVRPVLSVLHEGRHIAATIAPNDRYGRQMLQKAFAELLPPYRVAELLIAADYSDDEQRVAAGQFMANMPNEGLIAMLEWSASSGMEEVITFYQTLAQAAGNRLVALITGGDFEQHTDATLISIIRIIRVSGEQRFGHLRTQLARYRSLPVREAALEWYEDAMEIDQDDIIMLTEGLFDSKISITNAVLDVLEQHKPDAMKPRLEQYMTEERFQKFTAPQKKAICKAYAIVGQERALVLLERLLMSKLPLFGNDPATEDTIEAAAIGIQRVEADAARQLLERESSPWRLGVRKQICQRILNALPSNP